MTYTESLVWTELQELNRALPTGIFWQRQHVTGKYIIDFVCKKAMLGIEVDGKSHLDKQNYDKYRQFCLEQAGWEILHIGEDVYNPAALYAFVRAVKAKTMLRLNKYNR